MKPARDAGVDAVLREAFAFGLDLRHKKGCDWAHPASNFQKNKPCSCGRDTIYTKLNKAAFGDRA